MIHRFIRRTSSGNTNCFQFRRTTYAASVSGVDLFHFRACYVMVAMYVTLENRRKSRWGRLYLNRSSNLIFATRDRLRNLRIFRLATFRRRSYHASILPSCRKATEFGDLRTRSAFQDKRPTSSFYIQSTSAQTSGTRNAKLFRLMFL